MPDDASTEAAVANASGSADAPRSPSMLRRVPPATAEERLTREEGMARALKVGAKPYRDAEGKGRHIAFKEANLAPVEPWVRDPKAKRGYRRTQELRKAAGQLIGEPGDRIEIAKRLGVLHWEQGSDIEGAAARGLKDAIWSREHVYGTFTVPRHDGLTPIETGRVAAVAEVEARKIQAEDPKARGGFWVRDRNNLGLLYVVANAEPLLEEAEVRADGPETAEDEVLAGGGGEDVTLSQADASVDDQASLDDTVDKQSAPEADSTEKPEEAPVLHYPDIPLPRLEPTWQLPEDAKADELPVINMEKDRIRNILTNEPAIFEIEDSPRAKSAPPWHEFHRYGYIAVWVYQDVIEHEARRQGVDPNLVKTIMYLENARGASYGRPAEMVEELVPDWLQPKRIAESILPMNIQPDTWGEIIGMDESFNDPLVNIRAGVTIIRRIIERLSDPSVAKVSSIYGFTGYENVTDNGARAADFYQMRAWERNRPRLSPRAWQGLRTKRQALNQRLLNGESPR